MKSLFPEFQKFMIDNRESEELSAYKEIGEPSPEKDSKDLEKIQKQKEFVKNQEFEKMNFIQKKWIKFDEKVMKPFFVGKDKDEASGNDIHKKKPEMIEFTTKTFK